MEKELGKIQEAVFGCGGYQDVQIGLSLTFAGKAWGCGTFLSLRQLGFEMRFSQILKDAGVSSVDKLVGKPVEVTFERGVLKDWRILTEVL